MIVNINKIILFFILSIYSGILSILVTLKNPFITIICFLIYIFMLKVLKDNKNVLEVLLGITILVPIAQFFAPPHIKHIISNIFFASGYVFLIITLYYLISYMKMAKKLFIENKEYIYIDKFKYAFGPAIISVIIFGLFFYPLCIFEKHIGFMNTILIFSTFAVLTAAVAGFKLIPYMYAFKVLSLKNNGQIFIQDIYNGQDNDKFFNRFIEPYINHIYLVDNKICFYAQGKKEVKKEEKVNDNINILHSFIERIDNVINKAFENNAGIYNNLCSIKETMVKIEEIGSNNKLGSYIYDIENKYLPYIEKISQSYIENMKLPSDLTEEIQSKIEKSLSEVNKAMNEILKSIFTMKKIDVESSIDVMNIKLMQEGLLNSIKKDK